MLRFWRKSSSKRTAATKNKRASARRLLVESLDSRRVMASVYQNPGQAFDVNNDTYVDQEDVRLSEVRMNTVGAGQLPALRDHPLIPFYDVNGDGSFTKEDIDAVRSKINRGPGTISIKLANDSGNKLDNTTNDVRIVGRVMGYQAGDKVNARFGEGRWGWVDISNLVKRDGTFELSIHDLHRINGRLLPDSQQVFYAQSLDRSGRVRDEVELTFTIDRAAPTAFTLDAKVFESPIGTQPSTWVVRWNQKDARSYDLKVTTDAVGKNVVRFEHDLHQVHANRFVMDGLTAGTYYVWLTGFDEVGNRVEATGSGQRVEWLPTFNPVAAPSPPTPGPIFTPITVTPPQTVASYVDPARFTLSPEGNTAPDRWQVVWYRHSPYAKSYHLKVTRDAAGVDVAFERETGLNPHAISLTHLAAGKYYVFLTENHEVDGVILLHGAEVTWQPRRPGEFSVELPSEMAGDDLTVNWSEAEGAVRYEVNVYRIDAGLGVLNFIVPPGLDIYDHLHSNFFYSINHIQDVTTNSAYFENLEPGRYEIEVRAFDALGRVTHSQTRSYLLEFEVPEVGRKGGYGAELSTTYDGKLRVAVDRPQGAERVHIEFYSSADLNPNSLINSYTHHLFRFNLTLNPWLGYDRIYAKTKFLDAQGHEIRTGLITESAVDPALRKVWTEFPKAIKPKPTGPIWIEIRQALTLV